MPSLSSTKESASTAEYSLQQRVEYLERRVDTLVQQTIDAQQENLRLFTVLTGGVHRHVTDIDRLKEAVHIINDVLTGLINRIK